MDVDFDFSDVDSFFDEGEWEVEKKMIDVGDEAVKYAEEHGDYQDHTLTLRTSNDYDVNKDGLTLKNEAEYASFVESKGYDVLSSAALFAEKRLKEEFEKTYIKDIIERNNIQRVDVLDSIINMLASAVGSLTNPQKIYDTFRSNGEKELSLNTVNSYIRNIEDSFIVNKTRKS